MSRSLYAMLHRRFGPTLPESERCARIEAKLDLERAQWQAAALPADCKSKLSDTTVAIIGGGFAGLAAAWALCSERVMVTVFEAHDELGGRVRTDKVFTKDRLIEAGAELIGANHPRWIELARHFGLGLNLVTQEEDYERAGLEVKIWIDKLLSRDEAKKLYERMEKEVLKPIGQDAALINDPARPWLQPGLAKLDTMSVADKLTALKIKKTDLLWKAMEMYLGHNNVVASLTDQSYLALLCLVKGGMLPPDPDLMGYWQATEVYRCADGCQTLAAKMAAELVAKSRCTIRRNTAVTDIDLAKRVTLKWQNVGTGKQDQGQFDFVILAVPPSVWGDLKITPFDPKKTIGLIQMGPGVKFLSNLSDRFWIKQGVAPLSWSTMIGETWEGTDNQTRLGEQGIELSVFAGGRIPTVNEFKKGLEELFPGYSTHLKGTKLVDWPNEPYIKTGYASPKPGQVFTIGKELNEPFQGRMFFAGEHTAMDFFGYMEGSLRSGGRAAKALMAKVCGRPEEFVAGRSRTTVPVRLGGPLAASLDVEDAPSCYEILRSTTGNLSAIGFEFDLSYGASTTCPPLKMDRSDATWRGSVYSLEGKKITTHRKGPDGFRLEGDGNRIEIATKPFELSATGRTEMKKIMKAVLTLIKDFRDQCQKATPDDQGYPAAVGKPRHFKPGSLEAGVKCVFPLALSGKDSYYRETCSVAASPQATFELPLAKIDQLVSIIKDSEKFEVAGRALSGPSGWRQGVRSVALYEAQKEVNKSRDNLIKTKFELPDKTIVTNVNFSATLQGLLILMVSYLKTGLVTYGSADYEAYAKAYLPLNVKTPFRLLYDDLTDDEKKVFQGFYDNPRTNLWKLAKPTAKAADKDNMLFPKDRVESHQKGWFDHAPTWHDLVELTITNTPLKRTKSGPGEYKEPVGCEVLFAPLSRILPYESDSRRVIVEMRRLGFNWVFSHSFKSDTTGTEFPGWSEMTEMLFDLAVKLNK